MSVSRSTLFSHSAFGGYILLSLTLSVAIYCCPSRFRWLYIVVPHAFGGYILLSHTLFGGYILLSLTAFGGYILLSHTHYRWLYIVVPHAFGGYILLSLTLSVAMYCCPSRNSVAMYCCPSRFSLLISSSTVLFLFLLAL